MNNNLKQPTGLYWLFMTEIWERFGFYTIQTIAVLYLSNGLGFTDKKAFLVVANLNALLYLTPVPGGMIADKIIGAQRAIMMGVVLFAIGYMAMACPDESFFFIGCAVVIIANGFFKPNVSAIVGQLYEKNDPRRSGGFTIFYMGINIGALIPPLFVGYLVHQYGWHIGFFMAAFGMILSIVTFQFGRHYFKNSGLIPEGSWYTGREFGTWILLLTGSIIAMTGAYYLFQNPHFANIIIISFSILFVVYALYITAQCPPHKRSRMLACIILTLISIIFWSLYNQTFSSLMLFAQRNMEQTFLGLSITAENTQFFNPFYIIILTPVFNYIWLTLGKKGSDLSVASKFNLGIWAMTLGFATLWLGVTYFNQAGMTSPWWLVSSYGLQTIGELLISPIGLSMITTLVPRKHVGMMMGLWFLSQTAAFALSGQLASLTAIPEGISTQASSTIYAHAFGQFALLSLAIAIISFLLIPYIKSLITGTAKRSKATLQAF